MDFGPAETKPCVVYAQLLKTLCFKTRQLSLRPDQIPQVRQSLERYREVKKTLETISELNQYLLRLDRDEAHEKEREL